MIGILDLLDGAREDGGTTRGLVARVDIRGDECLTGALIEVKDLTHGRAIGLDPVDEEDTRADTYGAVVVFALLATVDGVLTLPEEVLMR